MKIKAQRVLILGLSLIELLTLAACASQSGTANETQVDNTQAITVTAETGQELNTLDFFGPGSDYIMVRDEEAGQAELNAFLIFKKAVKEKNQKISMTTDWLAEGKAPSEFELLFGNTNRPETAEALSKIEGSGYIICVINKKLVIAATTDKALSNAANYFVENCLGDDMEFTENFAVNGVETTVITRVTINGTELKDFTIVLDSLKIWELPDYTLKTFFTKYCGVRLNSKASSAVGDGHKIIIGGKKADGSTPSRFETEIYFKDGDLHLCCLTPTMAQKVIYTLIDQYLDKSGTVEVVLEEGVPQFNSTEADNWDDADPADFLSIQDRICRSCYKLQAILEYDKTQGIYFTYANSGYKSTVAEARRTGIRSTNCVILGNWAMKDAGFYTSGSYNHKYDGTFGYVFSTGCADFFNKYFDVIDVRERNTNMPALIASGEILPGDIIGFKDHNQTALPLGYAMDGGHGFCLESGQGARFDNFIGPNPCKKTIVGFIIRAKDAE